MSEFDDVPADFVRDFGDLMVDPSPVEINTTRYRLWCLMAAVQLAARHPEAAKTMPIRTAIEMARNLQAVLSTTPALAQVAERGWDLADGRTRQ